MRGTCILQNQSLVSQAEITLNTQAFGSKPNTARMVRQSFLLRRLAWVSSMKHLHLRRPNPI